MIATLLIPLLAVFAPVWATPVARLWYASGFEEDVTAALAAIDDSGAACIYDDTRNIFVTSVDQLNVDRMIRQAVRDKSPRLDMDGLQRDPHFRVYSNGRTYYWSFRSRKLHAFRGDRWSLVPQIERGCEAFRQDPRSLKQAYRDREGLLVTEDNFCCVTAADGT